MILNNDIHQDYPHRLVQVDRSDLSSRFVSYFQTKDEAVRRAATLNCKYPNALWLYKPPQGWAHLLEEEGLL